MCTWQNLGNPIKYTSQIAKCKARIRSPEGFICNGFILCNASGYLVVIKLLPLAVLKEVHFTLLLPHKQ